MQKTDVIIVGFGPVGALLTNLLGARGIQALVLEREREIFQLPRAIGFDDEVKRIFQAADLDTSFGRSAISLKGMDLIKPSGKLLRRFDLRDEPRLHGHPLITTFHQPELEGVIREGVNRYRESVDVRLGANVQAIRDLGDHVEVDFQGAGSETIETVEAKFVVGCDGSRSFVRKHFGIELEDLDFHQPWLVVDVIMKKQIDLDLWAQQICDFRRPATFVPAPPPRNRFEFMLVDGDDPETIANPARAQELIRPWLDPNDYEIERTAVYTFHALIAKEFSRNRVVLAGDAAHQMPPFLGQGMCAGIRDAFNLAWKLDLILSGQGDMELLSSYGSERKKHVRYVIKMAVRIGKIIQAPSRMMTLLRNTAMRVSELFGIQIVQKSMSLEPIGPGFFSESAVVPEQCRRPFPQPAVSNRRDGDRVGMDSFLGDQFTLLTRVGESDSDSDPLVRAVEVVGPDAEPNSDATPAPMFDADGAITAWLDEVNADAVLLRPDRVPFGIYRGADATILKVADDLQRHLAQNLAAGAGDSRPAPAISSRRQNHTTLSAGE